MRGLYYGMAGLLFSLGLAVSGMIDPIKVKSFLNITDGDWNPALLFVLVPSAAVYWIAYWNLKRKKLLSGKGVFTKKSQSIDVKLVTGAVLFGVGWGLLGICPGPALVHIAFLDMHFMVFIVAMFIGFEIEKRLNWPTSKR